jgi:hypothetical protein
LLAEGTARFLPGLAIDGLKWFTGLSTGMEALKLARKKGQLIGIGQLNRTG